MSRYLWIIDRRYHQTTRPDRDWMDQAACHGHDPELWFPARTRDRVTHALIKRRTQLAQETCQACPVQQACLHHAIATDARHGIWGGATEHDRARLTGRTAAQ